MIHFPSQQNLDYYLEDQNQLSTAPIPLTREDLNFTLDHPQHVKDYRRERWCLRSSHPRCRLRSGCQGGGCREGIVSLVVRN